MLLNTTRCTYKKALLPGTPPVVCNDVQPATLNGATADVYTATACCLPCFSYSGNSDFTSRAELGIEGQSRLDNDRCFVKESDSDADTDGSMARCVEAYQQDEQQVYIILILAMSPFQLIAAYVGWVLPNLYVKAHHQAKEDAAMEEHKAKSFETETENPAAKNK